MTEKSNNKGKRIEVSPSEVIEQIDSVVSNAELRRQEVLSKASIEGLRLRRCPYDSLKEKGLLDDGGALLREYQKIEQRESRLSSAERQLVSAIAEPSIRNAIRAKIKKMQKQPKKPKA